MAEIEFADGKRVVDDVYVEPINEVTEGSPERFTFQQAMDRIGRFVERSFLREAHKNVLSEHFEQWG